MAGVAFRATRVSAASCLRCLGTCVAVTASARLWATAATALRELTVEAVSPAIECIQYEANYVKVGITSKFSVQMTFAKT